MSSADAPAAAAAPLRNLRPFTIDVRQSDIEYLQRRLAAARALPSQLEDIRPWEDGTDRAYFEVPGFVAGRGVWVMRVACACASFLAFAAHDHPPSPPLNVSRAGTAPPGKHPP
jgi:hypothetical protein